MNRPFGITFRLMAASAGLLIASALGTNAAQPQLQTLLGGKWPKFARGSAADVTVVGNYAYLALSGSEYGGLAVIDISDPTNCVDVGGYNTSGWAYSVAVAGNYAYVADDAAGLQVIDVRDPAHCKRVGGYNTSGLARGVAVAGNYAYVADHDAGLQVIDVSNPTNCVRAGGYHTRVLEL